MSEAPEKELHLLDYWRVLVKRRWVVYTALSVVVTTVTLGSLLQRPIYTATTRLQIEQNTPKILPFQEVMGTVPDARNDFYQTQYGLIQSRRVASEVITSLDLAKQEEFRIKGDDGAKAGAARGDGTPGQAAGGDKAAAQAADAERVDLFQDKLKVTPVRNSRLVDIAFSSYDPALAARVTNRVAETYIAFNSEVQYNTTTRATTSLAHQIANLQEQIDAKEKELQGYAREHGIIELNDKQNIALKNLNDLSDAYTRARAARIEKEARYAALRDSDPGGLPEVLDSQLIRDMTAKSAELARRHAQMSEKYKPDWPEMVRLRREMDETRARLETERHAIYDQVLGVAESAYRAARNEETQLKRALDDQKRQSQEFGLTEIQFNNLKAEVANKRATLEALVKRQAETSSSAGVNESTVSNVRVVDAAEVPTRKSSPKILQNILLGILTGLALGVGLAFFFEYLDKSVKSPEEMHQASGVASIGLIPALTVEGTGLRVIKGNGREAATGPPVELISHEDSKSKISEAFRELRTALLVSQAGGPPRRILIASAQPGEGKTAVAVNLAITLAQIGRRVLLVDGDLRKPRLHKIFKIPNDRGLSSYLSGSGAPWPEPCRTAVAGLDVIPSGPLPPNPADLLDSERFLQVQREFAEQGYDHVIFDSPPVLAVADPAIMAGRMEAVIVVVHAGVTSRDALAHAVRRLLQVNARIVGAVMNRADLQQQGYYYGYSYKRYYGEEETRTPASAPAQAGTPEARAEKRRDPTAQA
jgi:capsular exopolysaccharide synthesis family protein